MICLFSRPFSNSHVIPNAHFPGNFAAHFAAAKSEPCAQQEPFTHVDWTPPIPVLDADIADQRVPEIESQVVQNPDDDDDVKGPETQFIKRPGDCLGIECHHDRGGRRSSANLDGTGGMIRLPLSLSHDAPQRDMRKRQRSQSQYDPAGPQQLHRADSRGRPPRHRSRRSFPTLEVVLPENTESTSLRGGWLMLADLSEWW